MEASSPDAGAAAIDTPAAATPTPMEEEGGGAAAATDPTATTTTNDNDEGTTNNSNSSNNKKVYVVPPRPGSAFPPVVLEAVDIEGPPRAPWQLQRYYSTKCGKCVFGGVWDGLGRGALVSALVGWGGVVGRRNRRGM